MLTSQLWQPQGLLIYWHQWMPMEKKEPSQVSIPFHSPQQIDEVLESTLTGLWIQRKRHLKWFIEGIYLAPSRFLVFLRLHVCLYPDCLLSFAGMKWPLRRWARKRKHLLYICPIPTSFQQMFHLLLNILSFFCVFFMIWIFLFIDLRNQLLWDQLWSKIYEFNDRRWHSWLHELMSAKR